MNNNIYDPNQGYGNPRQPYNAGQPVIYQVPTSRVTERDLPEELKPISAWGYFGYNLLFSIPLVGIILLFVFALGGTNKVNLKNSARSFFCSLIIVVIFWIILAATGALSNLSSLSYGR